MSPSGPRLRFFLGAFGEPGHAFPMLALGGRLVARGHEVTFETWSQWRPHVEQAGMRFVAAPEYPLFPGEGEPFEMYEAVVRATGQTREAVASVGPDAVIHDILTLAPAMAGELEGVPVATLVPHVYPVGAPGFPPYAVGARLPRTRIGSRVWNALARTTEGGLRQGRDQLNDARTRLGLPALQRLHGGLSEGLCLVGTFPQIEYPRRWPAATRVVGPLMWEPPFGPVDPPPGDAPLVLVAPSTAQDPSHRLLRAALAGLGGEPIRVLATSNRRPLPPGEPVDVPAEHQARRVDLLRQDDAGVRGGDLPRRPRDDGARAGLRLSGGRRPALWRHGRERRARRLGRGRGSSPVAPARARHAAAGGPPRTGHAVVAHARARAGGVGGGERRGWARGRVG